MADQSKTIISGGTGDYTTISGWEADSDTTSGFWKGEIQDNSSYSAVTISGATGTQTSANRVWLTVASANRHAGAWDTGKARLVNTSNGTHCITISDDYTQVEYLQIRQDSTGSSDEGIRLTSGVTGALISRCIIWTDSTATDTDGVYTGDWAASYSIDNSIIYGFTRGGIHLQNFQNSNSQTANIDYVGVFRCGDNSTTDSGNIVSRIGGGASNTLNIYNSASLESMNSSFNADYFEQSGSATWTGTNNASGDATLTSVGLTTGAQESLTLTATTQASGDFYVVNNITAGTEDFLLLDGDAGNKPFENGVDRVGSEPDSRQDFSLDIAGNTRSTTTPAPDIGASEYTAAGTTGGLTGTMTATVDEDDITTGGKTIIITITGDTFKAAGAGPIGSTADTQALIDGFDAASSPTNGWNNEVRDKADPTEVVRTSSTVATWTVAAQAGYDISAQEVITGTIPTAVLVTGAGAITATPTFTIDEVTTGRIMSSLANNGGLAGFGGIAGKGGGLAG